MPFTYAGHYSPEAFINNYGVPLRDQPITVYLAGTLTLATLYTDRTKSTTAPNPTSTDSRGNGHFWAEPGLYDLLVNGVTISSVGVPVDPAEEFETEEHDHDVDYEAAGSVATHAATPHGTAHPDLATHSGIGLATDAEVTSAVDALIPKALVDAKGDLLAGTAADTLGRVGVGPDGYVLTAASGISTGVTWAEPAAGGADIPQQDDPPGSPTAGDLWIDTNAPAATNIYYARVSTDLVVNPTPTTPTVVDGLTITIPSSATARMAFVFADVVFTGSHTNRFDIYLDGAAPVTSGDSRVANVHGGNSTYDIQYGGIPLALSAGSSHTIDIRWNASDSTAASTLKPRSLTVMVGEGSSSPVGI